MRAAAEATRDAPVMQQHVQAYDFRPVAAEPEDLNEVSLQEVGRTLWRGKLWILASAAVALTIGWYRVVYTAVPVFSATTEMALQIDSQPLADLQSVVTGISGDAASINTEMAVITSGELIGRLVDEMGLVNDPEFNGYLTDPDWRPDPVTRVKMAIKGALRSAADAVLPAAEGEAAEAEAAPTEAEQRQSTISAVRGAISTTSSYETYVFSITAMSQDPAKAVLLANSLAGLYRDDQIRSKVDATERMATWLSGRVGELRAELDTRENEIADLRARSSLVSDESLQALNEQAIELRTQLQQAQSQLDRTGERLALLEAADASGVRDAKIEAAQDGQLQAAAEADDAGAGLRFDRRFGQILLQTRADRDRAQGQVDTLQRTVDDLSAQFEQQSADLQALQQLEQDAEATRVLYETFLTRLKEATVQESAHQADSRILTEATSAGQIAPRPSRTLAMALFVGLFLGALVVLAREFVQNGFRTAEDLESRTGRTVLGQIPRIPARARPDTIRYLLDKPTSAAAEAVRNLRTSLLLSNVDRPPRVIMATSSVPNEGKTTLAISLAQNLAGLEKKVLLVEGDIRRRTFSAYFPEGADKGGLLSVVSGKLALEAAVTRPERLGIDVLMGERSSVNAADVFSSESFQRFLEQARSAYDYVVIDTPPVLVVPDARVIAQHVDALIYVVLWDATSSTQVEEGLRQFRSVNAPIAGLVLSRVDPKGMKRYGYGGRYGPYSRYGRNYYEA